ncbi:hypothetical protein CAPTEDRAFT_188666 [Capitella teleta]|uniref:Integrase zinc-binding domain-containing protein n=1 Tax=Capitella teleta TaxID=283909 RepID=R7V011_CAPTE|nr:hypothetical protein CAPTEDRAFT_188666 [Capitella teleta]|eukprot:ELU11857.1 hypothetical protein CAPTEDRAFT_188666 [Capitella teleta]
MSCECEEGYAKDNTHFEENCIGIDGCLGERRVDYNRDCHTCINTKGSHTCGCDSGYKLHPSGKSGRHLILGEGPDQDKATWQGARPEVGHAAFLKTLARVQEHYVWPGMQQHIRDYIRHCVLGNIFLRKFRQKSAGDEPLAHALNLNQREGMGQHLTDAAETVGDTELASLESIRRQCRQKAANGATHCHTYLKMNPDLCVHSIYEKKEEYVPDNKRIAATRFRLFSQRLLVETGRWSQMPRENRVCACDATSVQDETHVMLYSARTAQRC